MARCLIIYRVVQQIEGWQRPESRIGGSWFNRIGVLAIFLGVAFFLKYAVDNEWIGPTGRVLIGAAIGIAFVLAGERLRKRYPSYAYGLTGGGIAVLYATIWFASFQHMIARSAHGIRVHGGGDGAGFASGCAL